MMALLGMGQKKNVNCSVTKSTSTVPPANVESCDCNIYAVCAAFAIFDSCSLPLSRGDIAEIYPLSEHPYNEFSRTGRKQFNFKSIRFFPGWPYWYSGYLDIEV